MKEVRVTKWTKRVHPSTPNKNMPNKNMPNKNMPNKNMPNKNMPNKNVPDKNVPDKAHAPKHYGAWQSVPKNTIQSVRTQACLTTRTPDNAYEQKYAYTKKHNSAYM